MAAWDNAAYANDTYLASLRRSSQDVNRQVQNALQEIARQRQVASAQTTKIPGAANSAFGTAQGSMNAGLSELGVTPLASVLRAFTEGKASFGRASGLLRQGFGEQETQRRGAAGGLRQQLLADLERQGAQYVSQREAEDRQRAFMTEENARARAVQEAIARQSAAAAARNYGSPYPGPVPQPQQPTGPAGYSAGSAQNQWQRTQAFDEGFYKAVAAFGDAGGRHWLMNNQRPGGLTSGQQEFLTRTNPHQRPLRGLL